MKKIFDEKLKGNTQDSATAPVFVEPSQLSQMLKEACEAARTAYDHTRFSNGTPITPTPPVTFGDAADIKTGKTASELPEIAPPGQKAYRQ